MKFSAQKKKEALNSTSISTSSTPIDENMTLKHYNPVNKSSSSLHSADIAPYNAPIPSAYQNKGRISTFFHYHSNYFAGLASRIATIVVIIGVLIALGIGLRYTDNLPKQEDFSSLNFDWKINPSSYLTPYNTSFKYNVLLDGHSHSTYSDGKMNPRQLLDWHIGTQQIGRIDNSI